mmetsp:Transcript_107168/g.255847  ORF Transcript_107168/g.255847 Transcript_107168/m.255847 type:complete len:365 (-) Transcript_107168:100-1194(-)
MSNLLLEAHPAVLVEDQSSAVDDIEEIRVTAVIRVLGLLVSAIVRHVDLIVSDASDLIRAIRNAIDQRGLADIGPTHDGNAGPLDHLRPVGLLFRADLGDQPNRGKAGVDFVIVEDPSTALGKPKIKSLIVIHAVHSLNGHESLTLTQNFASSGRSLIGQGPHSDPLGTNLVLTLFEVVQRLGILLLHWRRGGGRSSLQRLRRLLRFLAGSHREVVIEKTEFLVARNFRRPAVRCRIIHTIEDAAGNVIYISNPRGFALGSVEARHSVLFLIPLLVIIVVVEVRHVRCLLPFDTFAKPHGRDLLILTPLLVVFEVELLISDKLTFGNRAGRLIPLLIVVPHLRPFGLFCRFTPVFCWPRGGMTG